MIKKLLFLLVLSIGTSLMVQAQITRYVSTTGSNPDPTTATSWTSSTANLQGAINASQPGDQVWVAAGTYKPTTTTGPDSRTISFAMKNGVKIYGGFMGNETDLGQRPGVNPITGNPSSTTLSGDIGTVGDATDNSYHVINNGTLDNSAVLDGFIITGGNAVGPNPYDVGGGMYNAAFGLASSPTLTNCLFQNNTAGEGGAIYNSGDFSSNTNPILTNCSFQNNSTTFGSNQFKSYGGAMYNFRSSPTLTSCSFQTNSAYAGGAIYNQCFSGSTTGISSPTLTSCTFQSNTAVSGGAMYNDGRSGTSSPTLANCSFLTNTAGAGGVMYNDGRGFGNSSPTMTNCLFQTNTASDRGGAMYNENGGGTSSPTLTNCSFLANEATNTGGAIANGIFSSISSGPTLTNCSFQNNTASEGGAISVGGATLMTNCVLFGNGGSKTIYNGNDPSVSASYSLFDASVTGYSSSPTNLTTTTSPFASTTSTQLTVCAPAINAGTNSATGLTGITTDLAGNPRFFNNGTVDMGAYEFQGTPNFPVAFTQQPASGSAVCVGGTVTASVSVSGTVLGYQWYNASGVVTGQTTATLSLSNVQTSDAGSYSAVVTGACNSVTSTAFSLTVNALPTAALSNNGPLSCTLTSVTLTANGGSSYNFSAGATQIGTSNQATATTAGVYSVTVANASGCTSTTSTTVTSATAIVTVSNPAITTATVNSPFSQTFTASNGQIPYSYSLASGSLPQGLTLTTGGVLSGTPTQGGSFSITVRATDANGCSGVGATYPLRVDNVVPVIEGLAASPNPVCAGSPVTFTATIGNISDTYSYTLSNGTAPLTGSSSNGAFSLSLTASGTGVQTYTLSVSSGGQLATATTPLTVNALPTAALSNNGPLSCTLTSVTLTASGGRSYSFSAGATQIGTSNQAMVTTAGVYSVTVANASGCTSTTSTTVGSVTAIVTVNNPATTTATVNSPFSQTFTASGGSGPYSFSLASGTLPTGLSLATTGVLSGTPTHSGSFSITVQATNANGCVGVGDVYVLTVRSASFTVTRAPASQTACVGSTVTFSVRVNPSEGVTYAWFKNSADPFQPVQATTADYVVSVTDGSTAGRYIVRVTGADGVQVEQREANLTVNQRPVSPPPLSGMPQLCPSNSPVNLGQYVSRTNPSYTVRYFDGNGQLLPSPRVVLNQPGSYPYTATQLDPATGCESLPTAFTLTVNPTTKIVKSPASQTACSGSNAVLTVVATGSNLKYEWFKGSISNVNKLSDNPTKQTGTATASLTLVKVSTTDNYYVRVTGDCGVVSSSAIRVTVRNCGTRLGAERGPAEESESVLTVTVLGNPATAKTVPVVVTGGSGQSLRFVVRDVRGSLVSEVVIDEASATHRQEVVLGSVSGLYLLEVSSPTQRQTVKIIRQ